MVFNIFGLFQNMFNDIKLQGPFMKKIFSVIFK